MARITEIAQEASDLRLSFPRLASVKVHGTSLHLGFLNLVPEAMFTAKLHLGESQISVPFPDAKMM